ncbi:DUF3281 family protein [Francisellaceae bacterium CB300]
MKKTIIATSIALGALALSSCSDSKTTNELQIEKQCTTANDLCKFELTNAVVVHQTNLLGKTTEKTLSRSPLQDIVGVINWVGVAENATVVADFDSGCENDTCTRTANPTALTFDAGNNSVSVTGTVTVDGKSVDLEAAVPSVDITTEQALDSVTFTMPAPGSTAEGVVIRPLAMTTQLIVDTLNAIKLDDGTTSAMHGTLTKDSDTQMTLTCDTGYEWLDHKTPTWGTSGFTSSGFTSSGFTSSGFTSGKARDRANLWDWRDDESDWRSKEDINDGFTAIGYGTGVDFFIGCWPIA